MMRGQASYAEAEMDARRHPKAVLMKVEARDRILERTAAKRR